MQRNTKNKWDLKFDLRNNYYKLRRFENLLIYSGPDFMPVIEYIEVKEHRGSQRAEQPLLLQGGLRL